MIFSSVIWNYYLLIYQKLLDSSEFAETTEQAAVQNQILKSSTMRSVIYLWKLLNPHNLNQIFLLSIFYDKAKNYVICMKYLGFILIFVVTLLSYLHACSAYQNLMSVFAWYVTKTNNKCKEIFPLGDIMYNVSYPQFIGNKDY